ncbi:protein of unknown function [Streptomyces murinus]
MLTQRGADRAKKRELEMAHAIQETRENRELRRSCYTQLHRDASSSPRCSACTCTSCGIARSGRRTYRRWKQPRTPIATGGPRL